MTGPVYIISIFTHELDVLRNVKMKMYESQRKSNASHRIATFLQFQVFAFHHIDLTFGFGILIPQLCDAMQQSHRDIRFDRVLFQVSLDSRRRLSLIRRLYVIIVIVVKNSAN